MLPASIKLVSWTLVLYWIDLILMECRILLHLSVLANVANCFVTALARLVAIKYKTPNYTQPTQQSTTYNCSCLQNILCYLPMYYSLHCLCLLADRQSSVQHYCLSPRTRAAWCRVPCCNQTMEQINIPQYPKKGKKPWKIPVFLRNRPF